LEGVSIRPNLQAGTTHWLLDFVQNSCRVVFVFQAGPVGGLNGMDFMQSPKAASNAKETTSF